MARGRGLGSFGDMLRTLVVLGAVLAVAVALTSGHHRPHAEPVDYQPQLAAFAGDAPFPVLAPVGLPATWQANHLRTVIDAQHRTAALDLGFYLTDTRAYVALEESNEPTASFLAAQGVDGPVGPVVVAAGRSFTVRREGQAGPALVYTNRTGVTVVLDGGGGLAELESLARALRQLP
ncbi:MAG: DUF4245 domain-containing protein [Mycobacteriales bacterium]